LKTHLGPPTREFDALEFALVVGIAFGLMIVGSLAAALSYDNKPLVFGDSELLGTIVYELIAAAVVWPILRSRKWKLTDFAIHYSRGSTLLGFIVAAAILVTWWLMELVMGSVPNEPSASVAMIALVSVLNLLFEELLVLGYVVQALRGRFGLVTAMNVSLAIRLSYHLYQGPMAVLPIAVFGVMVTLLYVRLGRLWPVIVAHALIDFVALVGWFE
jgi:membrane protease YdiL (CAAX protease family)